MSRFSSNAFVRYGFAVLCVLVATLLRFALNPAWEVKIPYSFFYPAVLVVPLVAGGGPGLLAIGLCAASSAYYFLPPWGFGIDDPADTANLGVFICVSLLIYWVALAQRKAHRIALEKTRQSEEELMERKQAEQEIRRLNRELERRVEERTRELVASNKELEAFSYSVGHDLRAPLRAISGFSEMLGEKVEGKLDDEAISYIHKVGENAVLMGRLVDELLWFSRLNRQEMRRSEIDMRYLFATIGNELRAAEPHRAITITVSEDLPYARGDEALIRQVVANLLSNAFKFTRYCSPALIEISSHRDGDEITYVVKDNGAGFDMKYADKLFGVFQRLHLQDEYEGTGIGLALVKRIVERHGGYVWAEGKVEEGATFYFSLPGGSVAL